MLVYDVDTFIGTIDLPSIAGMVPLDTDNKLESCCFKFSSRLLLSKKQLRFLHKTPSYNTSQCTKTLTGSLVSLQHPPILTLLPCYRLMLTPKNTHIVTVYNVWYNKNVVYTYINTVRIT